MSWLFHPLQFVLARCTKNELIRHIEFLRAENEILRTRVRRTFVRLNPDERNRLVKLGGDWAAAYA
jgi:putative transposase